MRFQRIRAAGINFRSENARSPALFHRSSTGVSQYEHLQSPADENHRLRLRLGRRRTVLEIAQARRNEGRYLPAHKRVRGHQKRR